MAPVPSDPDLASNLTSGLTSILACLIPALAFAYVAGVFWTLNYANRRKAPLGILMSQGSHRYAPIAYSFLVISGLVIIAIPAWVLLQYSVHHNYPNVDTRTAMRLGLFTACWTSVTAATFTILFVHPTWSRHPISSIGTQSIWILLTWAFWIASAAVLNSALPQLFNKDVCQQVVYCHHIQAIFSASSPSSINVARANDTIINTTSVSGLRMVLPLTQPVSSTAFTGGLILMMWLGWRCARD
ncbi:hypothetical protein GGX14DRAFT_504672, partial [Mycena pura]